MLHGLTKDIVIVLSIQKKGAKNSSLFSMNIRHQLLDPQDTIRIENVDNIEILDDEQKIAVKKALSDIRFLMLTDIVNKFLDSVACFMAQQKMEIPLLLMTQ